MKLLLFCLTACLAMVSGFKPKSFDYLDITGDRFDISWDDITDELWR